jgi:excisionase family DNA binding protein
MTTEVDTADKKTVEVEDQEKQTPNILTLKEVAVLLRVNQSTVSRYAKSGVLKSYKIGNRRLFKETDVWSFFDNQVDRECVFGKER